jgi:hypothetical protein
MESIEPDHDSTWDSESIRSDLTSLKSSIREYQHNNGRRYHNYDGVKYSFPNDEEEQNRLGMFRCLLKRTRAKGSLDLQHYLFCRTLGDRLGMCERGGWGKVLDIGTGTGICTVLQ